MVEYQILYWKDLPSQVRVRDGTRQVKRMLPDGFQKAIDGRATFEGAVTEDAYLAEWHWTEWQFRQGTAEEVAAQVVAELTGSTTTTEHDK